MQEKKASEPQQLIRFVKEMFTTVFKRGKLYILEPKIGLCIAAILVIWVVFSVYLPMRIGNYRSVQIESGFFAFYGITLGFLIVAYTSALSLINFRMRNARPGRRSEIITRYKNYFYFLFFTIFVNVVVLFIDVILQFFDSLYQLFIFASIRLFILGSFLILVTSIMMGFLQYSIGIISGSAYFTYMKSAKRR